MNDENYVLAKKLYEYIRVQAKEKDTFDQIDIAYISGLLEGLLVKNGYHEEPEKQPFKFSNLIGRN